MMWRRGGQWIDAVPRGQFWLYFCAALFFNFGLSVYFFLFNIYLFGFGYDERSLGILGSCAAAGGLCGTLPAGIVAQRRELRFALLSGMSLAIAACALRACVTTTVFQMTTAFVAGVGLSTLAVCLSPLVAALSTEATRPVAFSLIFASGIGDAGVGSLAAGWLPGWIAHHMTRRVPLLEVERDVLLLGCAVAALGLPILARLRLRLVPVPRGTWLPRPSPFLRKFLPFIVIWGIVTSSLPPFANVYLVHHLGFSLQQMGSILSIGQVVQLAGVLLYPFVSRRMGVERSILLTQAFTAVSLGMLAFAPTGIWAARLYWIYTASQYANEPGIYSLLMQRVPAADRNMASSYVFFVQAIAQTVASSAMGFSISALGYPATLLALTALACTAAMYLRLAIRSPASFPVTRSLQGD